MKDRPALTFIGGILVAFAMMVACLPFVEERVLRTVEDGSLAGRVSVLERGLRETATLKPVAARQDEGDGADIRRVASVERKLDQLDWQIGRAHQRLNEARLVSEGETPGVGYSCGASDSKETPYVMIGRRDGCGSTQSINYYRKLSLRIPPP